MDEAKSSRERLNGQWLEIGGWQTLQILQNIQDLKHKTCRFDRQAGVNMLPNIGCFKQTASMQMVTESRLALYVAQVATDLLPFINYYNIFAT